MTELVDLVQKQTSSYKPDVSEEEKSEFETTEKISWLEMVGRNAETSDYLGLFAGMFMSMLLGAALPGFCLIFGNMIDGVAETSDDNSFNALQEQSLYMIYIGCALLFIAWIQTSTLSNFGERITHRTQVNYFAQCLA